MEICSVCREGLKFLILYFYVFENTTLGLFFVLRTLQFKPIFLQLIWMRCTGCTQVGQAGSHEPTQLFQ